MKKKKTLHLRRIRERSSNKFRAFLPFEFPKIFNFYFYKIYKNKKKLLYSLMLSFYCINHSKVKNYLKQFGMTLNYRVKIHRTEKKFSRRLKLKFKKNLLIKYKLRNKKTSILKNYFVRSFKHIKKDPYYKRAYNVEWKKELMLHFSYRHLLHLPVRGQRTKTNAKIRKNYNII